VYLTSGHQLFTQQSEGDLTSGPQLFTELSEVDLTSGSQLFTRNKGRSDLNFNFIVLKSAQLQTIRDAAFAT
jgi:hypothetical protein